MQIGDEHPIPLMYDGTLIHERESLIAKSYRLAVFRDLKTERRVSMDRYADELLLMSQRHPYWNSNSYVLDETGTRDVLSSMDKLRRYQRRYIDYPRYAATIDADIFHIADHAFAFLVRSLQPERTIVTCHDLMLLTQDEWNDTTRWSMAVPLLRYSLSFIKRAAKIIAVSDKTKADLVRLGYADESQIAVIPPPVSEIFTPARRAERDETRRRLGLPRGEVLLLHVSSPSPYKNIETVIDVLVELRSRGVPATLVRVGRYMPKDLMERARQQGVEQWVRQLGFVDDMELTRIYGCADVFLFPSVKEGFGWPVLEAMASGLPVVASNVDAISQTLDGCGLQFDPKDVQGFADVIQRISTEDGLRIALTQSAIDRSKDFSREKVGSSIVRLYESVLDSSTL